MSENFIEIRNLKKRFSPKSPPALDNINADIPKGQIIGLVGPDGAGKTTLLRLIDGLLVPTEGTITVGGYDTVKEPDFIRIFTGYMPQKFGLYEDLTVIQNLELYADLRGVVGEERKQAFDRLLKFTGLAPFTKRLAGKLSGGMKQKLGLACSLIQKPRLLLLDEPSVGVDPISRRELWKMVFELLEEGITVIWSTAYLDEAEKCHTVLLLNEGKLLFQGPPQEMTKRVEGRVFKITHITGNRRQVLEKGRHHPNILDGVIQGSDVRILVKDPNQPFDLGVGEIVPVAPRFEDAFIDILGGGPKGDSQLAETTPEVEKTNTAVEAKGLTKKFGNFTAAENMTFTIPRGEIFGLLGPNGAGKTTTFKMMCGLLQPTSGKAYVNHVDLQTAPGEARAHIGYMAQKFSLYGPLSVDQNLEFFSGVYNLSGKQKDEAIREMIKIFNLESYENASAETLPLGFKQRLSLACATMHHPEVLFLDEPTSGVDPITRREFWMHINGMVEKGVTVLVTTHFMDEAEYCDEIALIYRGKTINSGTPDELKANAKTPENPNPTLEDAFVKLIEEYDAKNPL